MTRSLEASQRLPLKLEEVFEFFADAANLQQITPPELNFSILTPQPIRITQGTLIDYRLRLMGIPFLWQTRIDRWEPPHCFVDRQVRGPYRRWVHTHTFSEHGGETTMDDRVEYSLPLWPLGEFAGPWVGWQLERIFAYRRQAILRLLLQ